MFGLVSVGCLLNSADEELHKSDNLDVNCNLDSSFGTPLEGKYIETSSFGLSYSKTAVQMLASLTFSAFSICPVSYRAYYS